MAHVITIGPKHGFRGLCSRCFRDSARYHSTEASQTRKPRIQARYKLEENLTIAQLRREGYTYKSIAQRLNRDPLALRVHVYKNLETSSGPETHPEVSARQASLKGVPFTRAEDETVRELRRNGMAASGIARVIGRSKESISAHLQRAPRSQASLDVYERLKISKPTLDGRKSREKFTPLDAATIVYLRLYCANKWEEIVEMFPNRTITVLQAMYYRFWRERWKDFATTDPRTWGKEAVEEFLSPNRSDKVPHETQAGGLLQAQSKSSQRKVSLHQFSSWASHPRCKSLMQSRQYSTSPNGERYSGSEDALLLSLRESGLSCRKIGDRLRRSEGSVESRLDKLAASKKGLFTAEERDRISGLRSEGKSWTVIGEALGRSPKSVWAHFVLCQGSRRRPWSPLELADLVRLRSVDRLRFVTIAGMMQARSPRACEFAYGKLCARSGTPPVYVNRRWSAAEDVLLMRYKTAGKTFEEVARLIGNRTRHGVAKRHAHILVTQRRLAS